MKQIKAQIFKLFCLLLVVTFVFSGCSATAINDAIMDAVSKDDVVHEYSEPGAFVIEDETESTSDNSASESSADENKQEVENEQEVKERIIRSDDNKETIIKGLNESYPGYVRVNRKDNIECIGTDGTTLTLRSVEIYDSFYGSGLELNSSILEPDGTLNEFCKNMLNISSFILVDMEITYVAPAENEGGDAIFDFGQFVARWIEGDKDPEKEYPFPPYFTWFSDPPDGSDERIDPNHNHYSIIINDGETRTVQMGIFASPQYIEDNNVYLSLFTIDAGYYGGYKTRYFELLPEE